MKTFTNLLTKPFQVGILSLYSIFMIHRSFIFNFNRANDKNAQNMAKTPKTKFRLKLK